MLEIIKIYAKVIWILFTDKHEMLGYLQDIGEINEKYGGVK